MKSSFEEKTLTSKTLFEGRVIDLVFEEVLLPNGKTSTREIIKHPGAVAVIPITSDGKIVMVRQFRKALERELVEIPAGKLEKGEKPELTARRELEEETGYECETLDHLISFYTSPGFADEIVHVYIAEGLSKKVNKLELDEDEFVEVIELSLEEAKQYIQEQKIYDAKTAYAVQYLELKKAMER
ncbi:ADP-ribose pyrophosphatase [Bacillus mesophilus]|uniref:NUDIX hydrolase n=1 Tax=Bacillus mesophilus TaxID=1808955 RepID=A0A6M0Q7C2_9BACI|nr:NUDIX hydrolase [Bacillus mesophilus]MBM7661121.1 ADP-ribose pyrophosphatase [Bacillus mesophilus]NEY71350.1 NUDIX hydrolase [Bacillus mesophilus]